MSDTLSTTFVIIGFTIAIITYLFWHVIEYLVLTKIFKINYKPWEFILDFSFFGALPPAAPSVLKKPVRSFIIDFILMLLEFLSVAVSLLAGYFITKLIV